MQYTWDTHKILDWVLALASLGWLVVGLKIAVVMGKIKQTQLEMRITQLQDKADLVLKQTEIKEALTLAHSIAATKLDVHVAEDLQKFDAISHALTKIDTKLDNLAVIGLHK